MFEDGLSSTEASKLCGELDLDGAHEDVGEILIRLLGNLHDEAVEAFVGDGGVPPLWKFARRVVRRIKEDRGR